MKAKNILYLLLILFTGFSSYGKSIVIDAPINENIRFFRIPDSDKAIAFNFEKAEYEILKNNKACGYSSCSDIGKFTIGADSIICLDKDNDIDYCAILIGLNDGTDTPLKFEGFDSRTNKPLPFSYINYEQDSVRCGALWNVLYESAPKPCAIIHSGLPENIEIRTHSNYIKIDLCESGRIENTVAYYPIYLLQGESINKLVLYTDLDSFGARNRKYIMHEGEIYLIGLRSNRKLEELFPGQNCGKMSKLRFFITDQWSVNFIDSNYVPTKYVNEVL